MSPHRLTSENWNHNNYARAHFACGSPAGRFVDQLSAGGRALLPVLQHTQYPSFDSIDTKTCYNSPTYTQSSLPYSNLRPARIPRCDDAALRRVRTPPPPRTSASLPLPTAIEHRESYFSLYCGGWRPSSSSHLADPRYGPPTPDLRAELLAVSQNHIQLSTRLTPSDDGAPRKRLRLRRRSPSETPRDVDRRRYSCLYCDKKFARVGSSAMYHSPFDATLTLPNAAQPSAVETHEVSLLPRANTVSKSFGL